MRKNNNAQYQQNIDIIKGFFRKPIVLIAGIVTILSTIFSSVAGYLSFKEFSLTLNSFLTCYSDVFSADNEKYAVWVSFPNVFTLDIFAALTGLAFILLFAHGRSKGNSINSSVKFYKILANIQYILSVLFAVVCVLVIVATFVLNLDFTVKLIISICVAVFGILSFMYSFSKLRFAKSVKDSMNSIYLYKSWANAFGIFSLVMLTCDVAVFVLAVIFNAPTITLAAISVSLIPALLTAVIAFMYDSYISADEKGNIKLPESEKPKFAEPEEFLCKNCGTPYTEEDIFCHVCGNKLR